MKSLMKKSTADIVMAGPAKSRRSAPVKRLTGPVLLVAAALPAFLLGGCAKTSKKHFTVGTVKDDYRTRHPIMISEQEKTLDIPIATSAYDVPVTMQSSIEEFAFQYRRQANGNIRVMIPEGSPNQSAARRVSQKIINAINGVGVPVYRIQTVGYEASQHGATAPIRLSYSAISADVQKCGQWNKDLTETSENKNYHNFGCATQGNLAAMVANPADLLGPRGTTPIDATRRDNVIDSYRNGRDPSSTVTVETPPAVFGN